MTAMKAVEKTYMFSNESTKVLKEKRFDYKNGASITETTLVKKVYSKRYALLECGHILLSSARTVRQWNQRPIQLLLFCLKWQHGASVESRDLIGLLLFNRQGAN
jgi:hypothetical protein